MSNISAWLIIAQSNLHVGNESVDNYGLIDKAIQRDPVTTLPCINSSSLKGAINEFASQVLVKTVNSEDRKRIFGVDKTGNKNDTQKGDSSFFDAELLALPRPNDTTLYELVTCPAVLNRYAHRLNIFGLNMAPEELEEKIRANIIPLTIKSTPPKEIMPDFKVIDNAAFKELCEDYELPIIARNHLDNGKSANLWYEQVLPRETVLGTLTLSEEDKLNIILKDRIIQIGANATVGYGYCKFIQLISKTDSNA